MANPIKEQQPGLFADRTSTQTLRANQPRLYFSSFAYVLMQGLRQLGLTGTAYAKAQSLANLQHHPAWSPPGYNGYGFQALHRAIST